MPADLSLLELCTMDTERPRPGLLLVRRLAPSPLYLIVLLPVVLPLAYGFLHDIHFEVGQIIFFVAIGIAGVFYLVDRYRAVPSRLWSFDQAQRSVQIDRTVSYPFERLLRIELDRRMVNMGRGPPRQRFILTLCWLAGPEVIAAGGGSSLWQLADEIADCVGLQVVYTGYGRELTL